MTITEALAGIERTVKVGRFGPIITEDITAILTALANASHAVGAAAMRESAALQCEDTLEAYAQPGPAGPLSRAAAGACQNCADAIRALPLPAPAPAPCPNEESP